MAKTLKARLRLNGPSCSQSSALDFCPANARYGVGAGTVDSEGDGEGASTEPRVFEGFRFFAVFFCSGDGDAETLAGAVV